MFIFQMFSARLCTKYSKIFKLIGYLTPDGKELLLVVEVSIIITSMCISGKECTQFCNTIL